MQKKEENPNHNDLNSIMGETTASFDYDIIKFLKVRDVKSPERGHEHDAGIDFYVPEFTEDFLKDLIEKNPYLIINYEKIVLEPGERALIPSGIHCQMEYLGRALIAANKSGVATKTGLIFGAQVVDYEYQGEIHLSVINTTQGIVEIMPGMKILQFIEMPIYTSEIRITTDMDPSDFYEKETTRGDGGFGSTNKY
jgi:dUTP pyrophosphatase